ncbi:hypothetical protein EW145_g6528 [Phellinidium pouzarii]|uniref:Uncharacterized protein n=1 Tax=Phellinidium pouzarii TaxID=167371 RepID=A0A4S4KWF6_9AGAM|nr:hypothetical protein EW145_g6528 [Phellinidium pouzarii]
MMSNNRRSLSAVSRSPSKQPPSSKSSADIVTYRLDNEMVYVQPAPDFEEALNYAMTVFPQLAHVARDRIAFSVNVRVNGTLRTVRIASMAWERVLKSLSTYEIVDISVLPLPTISRAAKSDTDVRTSVTVDELLDDAPPTYGGPSPQGEGSGSYRDSSFLGADLQQNSEKSPLFTLTPPPPASPVMKRCTSALGWFGKH